MNLPWRLCLSDLKYHVVRLTEHAQIKTFISGIGTILVLFFGEMTTPMKGFLLLLVLDYVTGLAKAIKHKKLSSWLSRKGWGKLTTYAVVISFSHLIQQVGLSGMRDFALLWAGSTEGISVLENFDELGFELPEFIRDKLHHTKEKYEGDKE